MYECISPRRARSYPPYSERNIRVLSFLLKGFPPLPVSKGTLVLIVLLLTIYFRVRRA